MANQTVYLDDMLRWSLDWLIKVSRYDGNTSYHNKSSKGTSKFGRPLRTNRGRGPGQCLLGRRPWYTHSQNLLPYQQHKVSGECMLPVATILRVYTAQVQMRQPRHRRLSQRALRYTIIGPSQVPELQVSLIHPTHRLSSSMRSNCTRLPQTRLSLKSHTKHRYPLPAKPTPLLDTAMNLLSRSSSCP